MQRATNGKTGWPFKVLEFGDIFFIVSVLQMKLLSSGIKRHIGPWHSSVRNKAELSSYLTGHW